MQQIERYGVIALLFLMVTLVTVGLWGDGDTQAAGSDEPVAGAEPGDGQRARERRGREDALTPAEARARSREDAPLAFARDEATRDAAERRAAERRERELEKQRRLAQAPAEAPRRAAEAPLELEGFGYEAPRRDTTRRSPALAGDRPRRDESEALGVPGPVTIQAPPRNQDPPREARPAGPVYRVKPGDSLERIARRELGDGSRWREIQELNGIADPDIVVLGAKLVLPADAAPRGAEPKALLATNEPRPTQPAGGARTYTVRKGDVLSRIAQRECGTVKAIPRIVALNPKVQPDHILVGMQLVLPAADGAAEERSLVADAREVPRPERARRDDRYTVQ
jgi:LysM repeat protein